MKLVLNYSNAGYFWLGNPYFIREVTSIEFKSFFDCRTCVVNKRLKKWKTPTN